MIVSAEDNPIDFYEYLLLGPLSIIYSARKKTQFDDFLKYSNLIIDKFAIHSSSFFHLSKGIIEIKSPTKEERRGAYDLFSVNAVFRAMMENYSTFNHIFIEPKTKEEQKFRFLLWKIDGLADKQKLDIRETDSVNAKKTLDNDKVILEETIREFENCSFFPQIQREELWKIYKPDKKKYNWRFLTEEGKIRPLKISELIKHTCKTRGFTNTYRYTSIHTHTNYLAIEHFEQFRGKIIPDNYANPIIKMAIILTALLINDIVSIDKNSEIEFGKLPNEVKEYVVGTSKAIKSMHDD